LISLFLNIVVYVRDEVAREVYGYLINSTRAAEFDRSEFA
jgi:hypothetical protein